MSDLRSAPPSGYGVRLPYPVLCTLLGSALGWLPLLVHGPIPQKFNVLYIRGSTAVWAFYTARMLIGWWVGVTRWPRPWYVRGPLCGLLTLFPLTLISLAMPGCGWPWLFWNLVTSSVIGALVGGSAYGLTGKHHWWTMGEMYRLAEERQRRTTGTFCRREAPGQLKREVMAPATGEA